MPRRQSVLSHHQNPGLSIAACVLLVAALTLMRGIFAAVLPLRVDEAYYWTWSRESVISYLDHPPMVSWCVYFGTQIFGDTNFGVRFSGLVAMLVMQALLADIVWRTTRDWRYAILAVLLPEAALDYGLLITKIVPDTPLIVFALAMVWALVRLALSGNRRWWLLAGVFGGFALLSKYSVILLLPAIVAYAVFPRWRKTQLSSPYPWLAALIAVSIFSPVLYWNGIHDWASFRFQLDRPVQTQGWSLKFLAEFAGGQFLLLGPILFPMIVVGTTRFGWRGFLAKDPIAILLSMCVAVPVGFLLWRSMYGRIGDSWPLFVWPFGFACAAISRWRQEASGSAMVRISPSAAATAILTGIGFVVLVMIYYTGANANYLAEIDPIGKEAGFAQVAEAARKKLERVGATWFATTDYRIYSMLRWHLKDRIPVVQINERSRYIGFGTTEADVAGPVGLYVAPKDEIRSEFWGATTVLDRRPPELFVERQVLDVHLHERVVHPQPHDDRGFRAVHAIDDVLDLDLRALGRVGRLPAHGRRRRHHDRQERCHRHLAHTGPLENAEGDLHGGAKINRHAARPGRPEANLPGSARGGLVESIPEAVEHLQHAHFSGCHEDDLEPHDAFDLPGPRLLCVIRRWLERNLDWEIDPVAPRASGRRSRGRLEVEAGRTKLARVVLGSSHRRRRRLGEARELHVRRRTLGPASASRPRVEEPDQRRDMRDDHVAVGRCGGG